MLDVSEGKFIHFHPLGWIKTNRTETPFPTAVFSVTAFPFKLLQASY
jgi:hypothetical protein